MGWPGLSWREARSPSLSNPTGPCSLSPLVPCLCCLPFYLGITSSPQLTPEGPPLLQIELLDTVALNLHRIDKDVQRCDRNYWYFTPPNLERLRDIMCRYHCGLGSVGGGDPALRKARPGGALLPSPVPDPRLAPSVCCAPHPTPSSFSRSFRSQLWPRLSRKP